MSGLSRLIARLRGFTVDRRRIAALIRLWARPRAIRGDSYLPGQARAIAVGGDPSPPIAPPAASIPMNRQGRRAVNQEIRRLERQRRKFDKWVQPKGPAPAPIKRNRSPVPALKVKPEATPPPVLAPSDLNAKGPHHSDRKTEVLYLGREFQGEFHFRDTILEQLDRYFTYIDRMRRLDPDAYEFYRRVGAQIVPYVGTVDIGRLQRGDKHSDVSRDRLTPWFLRHRPAFGCIAFAANPEGERQERELGTRRKDMWIAKFLYFQKYHQPPPELQPMSGGDTYVMTVWWDRPDKRRKYGSPQCFGVFVDRDSGEWTILRSLDTKFVPIRKRGVGPILGHVPQRAWTIPDDYKRWAKENGTDVQTFLGNIFCAATRDVENASLSVCRISVEKKGRYALFSIDPERMPYFFADRDFSLNDAGGRKKIFHQVRAHTRANGEQVKMHFRGEREFEWAGYHVSVSVPGLHHVMLEEYDVGASDGYWINKKRKKGWLGQAQVGALLRGEMNRLLTRARQ